MKRARWAWSPIVTVGVVAVISASGPILAAGPPGCAKVQVSSAVETGGAPGRRFSATRTIDLTFTVLFEEALAGEHVVEVKVYTPRGHLYQSLMVPTVDAAGAEGTRRVSGYPGSVPAKAARPVLDKGRTYYAVDLVFAVAGTPVVGNSLYGRWTVVAHIDGERSPCCPPTRFFISQ